MVVDMNASSDGNNPYGRRRACEIIGRSTRPSLDPETATPDAAFVSSSLESARAGDHDAFRALVEPHRRELRAHCYRMSGSLHDADDLLQESLLRAWRGIDGFEGRASLRTWLYKVTTHACLDKLGAR